MTALRGLHYSACMMNAEAGNLSLSAAPTWEPFRGPFQRWPRTADFLLAVLAFLLTVVMWWPFPGEGEPSPAITPLFVTNLILIVIGNGAIFWRRSHPLQVHAVVWLASAAVLMLGEMNDGVFAMAFSLYSLGRYADNDRGSMIGVGASLGLAMIDMFLMSTPSIGSFIALTLIFAFWYVGRRLRFRGEYLSLLQAHARNLEQQKDIEAGRAVSEERTRIARELHDIVAHQVSLMTVQAGAAKTVAEKDPKAARAAMASVESAGRQALDELRHLLGVLRPETTGEGLGPQPGSSDIPHLVSELTRAGLDVDLQIDGIDGRLPARIDLAIYRIVQEALTNVLKHSGRGTAARVRIASGDRGVALEVRDNGAGQSTLPGSGHGLRGMRERIELLGGTLEAEPMPEGGFRVRVFLPLEEDRQ